MVADFINRSDMSLDDLSYDIIECIRCWSRYRYDDNSADTVCRLAEEMYLLKVAKTRSDSEILASFCMEQLYPDMTRALKELDCEIASVYEVRILAKPGKKIRCSVVFAVP